MKHTRLILGSILLLILLSLMLYYALDHNNHDPEPRYIIDHYQQFRYTKIAMVGEVQKINTTNNTLLLQVSWSRGDIMWVTTTEPLQTIHPGDTVEAYGLLSDGTHMTADTLLITQQWKDDLIYLRSLPAIPFALYLFFRAYHFNPTTRCFERRQKHA